MLKIFVAESLPNAVQMFADALTGGDIAKLNAGMADGLFKGKDLLKVAAHMKTLVDPKLMEQMLKAPEKQVTRLKNSWLEFMMALNDSGLWGAIGKGVDGLTKAIKELTPEVKRIYPIFEHFFKFMWENAGLLTSFYIGFKAISGVMAVFSTAAAAGQVMTLTKAFRILAGVMLRTVVIPAAIIAAILLAVDTIDAFTNKKKGIIADFSPKGEDDKNKAQAVGSILNLEKSTDELKKNPNSKFHKQRVFSALRTYQERGGAYAGQTPEQRQDMAKMLREKLPANVLNEGEVATLLRNLDSSVATQQESIRRFDPIALNKNSSGYNKFANSNSSPVINVTIQNTAPNVNKEWLVATMPSVFRDAMSQHVQGEFSMFPNQSRGTSE